MIFSSRKAKFDCGEYRSTNNYGYGLYEVSMKPAKNTGIVSSFFTYTGPAHGTQWDEIDIEFLGKDTTKVQFNYFMNGVGGLRRLLTLALMHHRDSIPMLSTGNQGISSGMLMAY